MPCPQCNYLMDAIDSECPRCHDTKEVIAPPISAIPAIAHPINAQGRVLAPPKIPPLPQPIEVEQGWLHRFHLKPNKKKH